VNAVAARTPALAARTPAEVRAPAAEGLRPWIVSRAQDLLWFQGSVLAGVALLVFFLLSPRAPGGPAGQPALIALLLWGVLLDGTHVAGTYARSYLSSDRRERAGLPGRWSLALLAVGPLAAVIDHVVPPARGRLFPIFLLAAFLWAYWHLVRQHWGFLALYRRRADDATPAVLDQAVLWLGCLWPFARFSLDPAYAGSGLPPLLPASALDDARVALDVAFAGATLALGALWVRRGGVRAPGPKHLLLAIVIAFHAVVFTLLDDLLAMTATLTIFHNLQYHRIVWQHEASRGRRPLGGIGPYLLAGLALGAAWYGPRVMGAHLAGPGLLRNVLLGAGWGVAFHHYLVDGRIWRARRAEAAGR
jgi:hypothetical protein